MALAKAISIQTLSNGSDIKVTDNSLYTVDNPKSLYSNRHLVFTFADGTQIIKEFPYTNTTNTIVDVITYPNFYITDFIVSVQVDFVSGVTETITVNYISFNKSLNFRSIIANSISLYDPTNNNDNSLGLLSEIDTNIESARYAAEVSQMSKSQKFLDRVNELYISYTNGC